MFDPLQLRQVLLVHSGRYPLMEPQDAVKLLYQRQFGCGHLIKDPAGSLAALEREHAGVPRDLSAPLLEELGGGMVRVMLSPLDPACYPLELLNEDLVRSAGKPAGSLEGFLGEVDVLRACAREGLLPFSPQQLEQFLLPYLSAGCPVLSHSAPYRQAYRPAYRVVDRSSAAGLLVWDILRLSRGQAPVLTAIDGRCAAGKTTLAASLQRRFGWSTVHMDHFFLRPEQRTPQRLAVPGENVDHERFLQQVLLPLKTGRTVSYRPFDCRSQQLAPPVEVPAAPVVLVEGSYSCHPALRAHYHLRAFLTVDPQEQLRRILRRNGPEGLTAFQDRWIPLEERYFAAYPPEEGCHHILAL